MISVAMCTYNGARFLLEQLESISRQTLQVDELVVCDDRSKDTSVAIIQEFAKKVSFPVRIHINDVNLGSTLNFQKCLTLCSGDFIFLCDQDDLWREDKVERQMKFFADHPGKMAVFSNASIIDDDSEPTGVSIWEQVEFTPSKRRRWRNGHAYEILYSNFVVTGATLALRKECLAPLLPFPQDIPELIHDGWIAMVLSLHEQIDFISERLISYRVHISQQVGFGTKIEPVTLKDRLVRNRKQKLSPIREKAIRLKLTYKRLEKFGNVDPDKLKKLQVRMEHFQKRATLPKNRLKRIIPVVSDLFAGKYMYSSKDWWLPALGDIFE